MHEDSEDAGVLLVPVEVGLQILSSWTLAYHLCIALKLPARIVYLPFALLLAALVFESAPRWRRALRDASRPALAFSAVVVSLGAGIGFLGLFVSRPDADDLQYFYRPLLQLSQLGQPFIRSEMIHNVANLPLSWVLTVTSYEFLVAMGAHLFGIDPLFAYHDLAPFAASIFLVITYVLVFRHFGLERGSALGGALLVCIFLLIDGNTHRSFGSVTLARLWQGKALMWTLLIPLSLLASHRYLERPGAAAFLRVLMIAIGAGGLSSSGLFLIPAMILSASIAFVLTQGPSRPLLGRAMRLNLASSYSGCILLAMSLGWLPTYSLDALFGSWPGTWAGNLQLVVDGARGLARDLILLFAVPALFLSRPYGRFFVVLSVVLIALFTNPVSGPLFLKLLQPGAYWRLAYLFPLPLCAGLLARTFAEPDLARSARRLRIGVALLAVGSIVVAYDHSVLTPGPDMPLVWVKSPSDYRFPPREYEFCAPLAGELDGRNLLAPESIVHVLPLLDPSIHLETARALQTRFAFASAGMPEEGRRRVAAQRLVTDCRRSRAGVAALVRSLEHGVDAVVLGRCDAGRRARLKAWLEARPGGWVVADERLGYTLLLRTSPARLSRHELAPPASPPIDAQHGEPGIGGRNR